MSGKKRPIMIDSNLIRYFGGDQLPDNPHTKKQFENFCELVREDQDVRICLPQQVELYKLVSKYERALKKDPVNRSDEENDIISAIELLAADDEDSRILAADVEPILSDKRQFNLSFSDLMIAYLARRNGWALISAEGEDKPIQKYIEHYGLTP
jgi:hypothetical protein